MTNNVDFESIFYGGFSGIASRLATAPLDVLKIRMELRESGRIRIFHIIRDIFKHEGFLGFWKGNASGIYLYATYSATQFFVYENMKSISPLNVSGFGLFGAGSVSGLIATVVSYPFDVMRTRFCIRGRENSYNNILHAIRLIYLQEGVLGFYKGITPSLLQIAPYIGMTFWSYEFAKSHIAAFDNLFPATETKGMSDFICGGISGLVAKTSTMPFDVVRKRLQIQCPLQDKFIIKTSTYTGVVDCVRKIWLNEGPFAFYKGLSVALMKSIPAMAVSFFTFHTLKGS